VHLACASGHMPCVQFLVHRDAEQVGARDHSGATPLHVACENGHLRMVNFLLTVPGVDVNVTRKDGSSPLFLACQRGYASVARSLLASDGILVNLDNHGETPLFAASYFGHTDIVQYLLSIPQVRVSRRLAFSPLEAATERGHTDICLLLSQSPTVRLRAILWLESYWSSAALAIALCRVRGPERALLSPAVCQFLVASLLQNFESADGADAITARQSFSDSRTPSRSPSYNNLALSRQNSLAAQKLRAKMSDTVENLTKFIVSPETQS